MKNYIGYNDLSAEIQNRGIAFLSAILNAQDPRYAQIAAMKRLNGMIKDDKDYQWILHYDQTTDEILTRKIHTLDEHIVGDCDLEKIELHTLVKRERWRDVPDAGTNKDGPPQSRYNLFEHRGGYSPSTDDFIWLVLQPALQLITRVLQTNHPFWTSLLNIYTRRNIDISRDAGWQDPKFNRESPLVSFSTGLAPNAVWLMNSGFDILGAVNQVLDERLVIQLGSKNWRPTEDQEDSDEEGDILDDKSWARTMAYGLLLQDPVTNKAEFPFSKDRDDQFLDRVRRVGDEYVASTADGDQIEPYWNNEPR
ncbi:hypothetical protein B0H63DRAFT_518773 [Podospora didyma]|uniref:Uncharacterized protein n=1 Tax=Podospora didyma TaxID=330526 RepID=A0AAE0U3J4_9PEZI|nr:hypothetical protein B0H63DRAFT_518773 [Podospora didyma]